MSGSKTAGFMADKATLEDLVICSLCFEKFNMQARLPKVTPCGHTFCLDCLNKAVKKSGRICPHCRSSFEEAPFFLQSNFQICQVLGDEPSDSKEEPAPSAVAYRFYCHRCDDNATERCLLDHHEVSDKTSLVRKRIKEAKEQSKVQFEREAAILKDLTTDLSDVKNAIMQKKGFSSRLQQELDQLKKQKEVLEKTAQVVEKAAAASFEENEDVPQALERFLKENGERLFELENQKSMLEMAKKCTVTVTSEEAGLAWGADLTLGNDSPAEERVLVYLVYLLLLNQQQRHVEAGTPTTPGDTDPSAPGVAGAQAGDGKRERASWASGVATTTSLDELITHVKECVIDGRAVESDDSDDDDDDDSSETTSMASLATEASSLPEACRTAKKVFVGKIPPSSKPEEIKGLFSKFGRILYVRFLNVRAPKGKAPQGKQKTQKSICALLYVPDEFTVENILRNRPIVFRKQGQIGGTLLNVQEERSQKREAKVEAKVEAKRQRRQKKQNNANEKKVPVVHDVQQDDKAGRIFVNHVPDNISEEQLKNRLATYGAVEDVIKRRHGTGGKCFAIIVYKDKKAAERALAARPIKLSVQGCPEAIDLQVKEYSPPSGPRPAPAQNAAPASLLGPPPRAPVVTGPNINYAETMAAAAAATSAAAASSAALLANCVSNIQNRESGHNSVENRNRQQPQPPQLPPRGSFPKAQQRQTQPSQQPQQHPRQQHPRQPPQQQPRQQGSKDKDNDCCLM